MKSFLAAIAVLLSSSAMAQDSGETVGSLLAAGGEVKAVITTQEWPYFYITKDNKLYTCSLNYDEGAKIYDYRAPPPASVSTRCTELK